MNREERKECGGRAGGKDGEGGERDLGGRAREETRREDGVVEGAVGGDVD